MRFGGALVVSRWCLRGVSMVLVVPWCVVSWWCVCGVLWCLRDVYGVLMAIKIGNLLGNLLGNLGVSVVSLWCFGGVSGVSR